MRAAWRLAINNLSQRRSRTLLLVCSVAMCAALISVIACAIASVNKNLDSRLAETVGAADVRITRPGDGQFPPSVVAAVDAWPETQLAVGRGREAIPLLNQRTGKRQAAVGYGVDPQREFRIRPLKMIEGRHVQANGEVLIDERLAKALEAKIGDSLQVERFGDEVTVKVVGISTPPAFGTIFTEMPAYMTLKTLAGAAEHPERLLEIDVVLKPGSDPERVAEKYKGTLPEGLILQPSARITSGLQKNQQSAQIIFMLAGVIAFLAASFIIMTGLTTNLTERTRELAILRCIGAEKRVLAWAQVFIGGLIGGAGALVGVPAGVLAAWALISIFHEQLPSGFQMSWTGVALSLVGAIGAGFIGASWPAASATRISPLQGLSTRARRVRPIFWQLCVILGVLGPLTQLIIVLTLQGQPSLFWVYMGVGLPLMFTGYFLVGVPVMYLVTHALSGVVTKLLGLPPRLLRRTVAATPYRHGFTASAMMIGLALMTSIWTNGHGVLTDWVDQLQFPDMFSAGPNLPEQTVQRIKAVPGVARVAPIASLNVDLNLERDGRNHATFGIAGLTKYKTTFIAFDPEPFFAMTRLVWVQGNEDEAMRELAKGGAILVAREFLIARGIGVGEKVKLRFQDKEREFRVVGVVHSPGLDIASKFFSIGEGYVEQAVNSVFGTRADLQETFGAGNISLIQIGLQEGADAEAVKKQIDGLRASGILETKVAKGIKDEIRKFIGGTLAVMAIVAVGAMLVACFGVANLIVAGVQTRQFEFGVLLAVGSPRGLLGRLVIGEALLIAIAACIVGTLFGVQGAWGGQHITQASVGLELPFKPPVLPIAAGWLTLGLITLLAAAPTAWRLAQRRPRELLGSMKG